MLNTNSNNLELWKFSLENPEPSFGDPYYVLDNANIITKSKDGKPHPLLVLEENITELIDKYSRSNYEEILSQMVNLLDNDYSNSTTFISYWHQHDMSFSVYKDLETSIKKDFLQYILPQYIANRHEFYKKHKYSPISLQVAIDNAGHKESGNLSNKKIKAMCEVAGLKDLNDLNLILTNKFSFTIIRGDSKELLDNFCSKMAIEFKWRVNHKRKNPDFIINFNNKFFICEAKHKKEGGGGQNDQMLELIELISFSEKRNDFGYVSFLDGLLFNKLSEVYFQSKINRITSSKLNKIQNLYNSINTHLSNNQNNYFLNTKGLELFLKTHTSNK